MRQPCRHAVAQISRLTPPGTTVMCEKPKTHEVETPVEPLTPQTLEVIQEALQGLHFGQVLLVVHEGVVVQVERTERKRLSRNGEVL